MKIKFIGDVHGKVKRYKDKIKKRDFDISIQIGDFGFKNEHEIMKSIFKEKNYVLFGNHDYYPALNNEYSVTPSGGMFKGLFFAVRGAFSIDRVVRKENFDWFANEEITNAEAYEIIDRYIEAKPEIVVTHDCPRSIQKEIWDIDNTSITANLLETMFQQHKPKLWIFGHHHESVTKEFEGTTFRCLAELESVIYDSETNKII